MTKDIEPTLSDEQRAEWDGYLQLSRSALIEHPRMMQRFLVETIIAVAERLDFLESSLVALRAEFAQAREEQRRGEEALRAALPIIEEANHVQSTQRELDKPLPSGEGRPDLHLRLQQINDSELAIKRLCRAVERYDAALASSDAPTPASQEEG